MNLINKSQRKIIKKIINNPGINLRGIIEESKLSPNFVSEYVNLLAEKDIIKEERLEKKRVYLRRFYFNFKSELAKSLFKIVKEEEKTAFFEKYNRLGPIFQQLVEELKDKADFILVYGSYARLAAEKGSDLDLLVVGNIKSKDKEKIKEIFVTLDIEISIKIETLENFKKRKEEGLHQQILRDNILIYDSGGFVGAAD